MKLTKLHDRIRYQFTKLNYSVQTRSVIWDMLADEGWTPQQFVEAFDELIKAGYLGKTELYWCRIKPKRGRR